MQNQKFTIMMEKTTYTYCEKLVYSIEVSEITGEPSKSFSSETVSGVSSSA